MSRRGPITLAILLGAITTARTESGSRDMETAAPPRAGGLRVIA